MLSKNGDITSFDFSVGELHNAFKEFYDLFLHGGAKDYQQVLETRCNKRDVSLCDLLFTDTETSSWLFYIGDGKKVRLTKDHCMVNEKAANDICIDLPYLEYDFEMEKMFLSDLVDLYEQASELSRAREEIMTNHECASTYYCSKSHEDKVAGKFDKENCDMRVGWWLEAINLNTSAWKKKTSEAVEDYMRKVHPEDINNLNIFELVYVETSIDSWWSLRDTTKMGSGVSITL